MPKLWPVLSQGFTAVFSRLGIQAVPAGPQWFLSDTIVPVSLIDTDVVLSAVVTVPLQIRSSAGTQQASAAGAVLADTGQLNAGNFRFVVFMTMADPTNSNRFEIQHRNAANAANITEDTVETLAAVGETQRTLEFTARLAQNERMRVTVLAAVAAGRNAQVSIYHNAL